MAACLISVLTIVCVLICQQDNARSAGWIFVKFGVCFHYGPEEFIKFWMVGIRNGLVQLLLIGYDLAWWRYALYRVLSN